MRDGRFHQDRYRESERLLMHLIRKNGALSKAELARMSRMSAQGVSVIIDRLIDDELVTKGEKRRGRVGQPSTPIILNANGAFSLGAYLGADCLELAVIDFAGEAVDVRQIDFEVGNAPTDIVAAIADMAQSSLDAVGDAYRNRVAGLAVAAGPSIIGEIGGRRADGMTARSTARLQSRLEDMLGMPSMIVNDIRAACLAEMTVGSAQDVQNLLYFYLGEQVGASVVVEGTLVGPQDRPSNSLHALPIARAANDGGSAQLIDLVSLGWLKDTDTDTPEQADLFETWKGQAAPALAEAIRTANFAVPLERVVLESGLSENRAMSLIAAIDACLRDDRVNLTGESPMLSRGSFSQKSRAIGAAILPLLQSFGPEQYAATITRGRFAAA